MTKSNKHFILVAIIIMLQLFCTSYAENGVDYWLGNVHIALPDLWTEALKTDEMIILANNNNGVLMVTLSYPYVGQYFDDFDRTVGNAYMKYIDGSQNLSENKRVEITDEYALYRFSGKTENVPFSTAIIIGKYCMVSLMYMDTERTTGSCDPDLNKILESVTFDTNRSFSFSSIPLTFVIDEMEYDILTPDNPDHSLTIGRNSLDKQYLDDWFNKSSEADVILYDAQNIFSRISINIKIEENYMPGASVLKDGKAISLEEAKELFKNAIGQGMDVVVINGIPYVKGEYKLLMLHQDFYFTIIDGTLIRAYVSNLLGKNSSIDQQKLYDIICSFDYGDFAPAPVMDYSKRVIDLDNTGVKLIIDEKLYDVLVPDNDPHAPTLQRYHMDKEAADKEWNDYYDGFAAVVFEEGELDKFSSEYSFMTFEASGFCDSLATATYSTVQTFIGVFDDDECRFTGTEEINGSLYTIYLDDGGYYNILYYITVEKGVGIMVSSMDMLNRDPELLKPVIRDLINRIQF